MAENVNRRSFLKGAAAAAGAAGLSGRARRAAKAAAKTTANDRLAVAVVGVAGRGGANLHGVARAGAEIVGLCDVDAHRLAAAAKRFPKADTFADFRKMLTKLDKRIEAVVVSTPDHTHAPAAAMALRMGKHCYCEKPLTHSVHECRTVIELAAENRAATQMGTQIHAGENYRRVVELVRAGAVGTVGEVHVWCSVRYGGVKRPTDKPPVPDHLDWDLWLGPAPWRAYHPCYLPGRWRNWWDFGCGGLGDFGCHYMDLPFWALGLRHPTTVEAEGPRVDAESVPRWLIVRYEFPRPGAGPPVKMTWYDGGRQPKLLAEALGGSQRGRWKSGVLFVGSKGLLLANYHARMLLPKDKFAGYAPPKPTIPSSIGHHREWVTACKGDRKTTCNFDYSGALAEAVLLGNVAYRTGEKLQWDWQKLKATNTPKADRYIRREYRKGWTL